MTNAFTPETPLVLVGAGKMGGAMLAGWLDRGLSPGAVHVIDPAPPADTAALLQRAGIVPAAAAPPGVTASAMIIAVKPQMMAEVLPALAPLLGPDSLAISIAAGTTLWRLAAGLAGAGNLAIVRAMPNTPAQIGRGITVAVANRAVDERRREMAGALLAAAGAVEWVDDEALIDAVTAVSGSGPAYLFLLTEALAEAGAAAGLEPALATRLARATVSGAAALMEATGDDAATLRRNVTSKGGTTAAALEVLDGEPGLRDLMRRAVLAAQRRSQELAG